MTAALHGADPSLVGRGAVALLTRYYSLRMGTADRVAGRETDVVEAVRPGADGRVVARFWLDRESGVVLRREVYDAAGRAVRVSAFTDVRLTAGAERHCDDGLRRTAGPGARRWTPRPSPG